MTSRSGDLAGQSSEVTSDIDVSFLKIVILTALTAVSAAVVGYFLIKPNLVHTLTAIGIFLTLFVFQVLLVKSWNKILPAVLAESVFLALPIIIDVRGLPFYLIIAWIAFLTIALYIEYAGTGKIKDSLRIPFWRISRMVFTGMFAAVLLFASIVYIFVPAPADSRLAAAAGSAGEMAVVRPIKYFVPEFSSSTTAGQLFIILAERAVNGQEFTKDLSASERSKLVQETAARYRSLVEERIGPVDSNLPVADAIAKSGSDYMSRLNPSEFVFINLIIFASLWLFFKGIGFILYLPASIAIFLIYETLIVTNFISIQYESRSREIALLK